MRVAIHLDIICENNGAQLSKTGGATCMTKTAKLLTVFFSVDLFQMFFRYWLYNFLIGFAGQGTWG